MRRAGRYPAARLAPVVDHYHGVAVPDPYRWLEDPDSPESQTWIEAENTVTAQYVQAIPERAGLLARLTRLWDYEKYSVPFTAGGRIFWWHNSGLQNQPVLYVSDGGDGSGGARVLLDPNGLSPDNTVSVPSLAISDDGRHLAYGISVSGSDWEEWRVREVASGKDLPDKLSWVKFSGTSWSHDGRGFYYARYDEPLPGAELRQENRFQRIFFHRLGERQEQDRLIYERPDGADWFLGGGETEDGRFLLLSVTKGTPEGPQNLVLVRDLSQGGSLLPLIGEFHALFHNVGNDGSLFYFLTDADAPRRKLIAIDLAEPAPEHWKTLVGESADKLEMVSLVGDSFFLHYLHDAHSVIREHDLAGTFVREVPLPGIGTVAGFGGRRTDAETYYSFTSFTEPGVIFRWDLANAEGALFRRAASGIDASALEIRQVFFPSKDGTRIPMFLVHRKGLVLDGTNPTYLYGYGGFNISLTPAYSPSIAMWLEAGGVFAEPNLRGGGEYGEEWHRAGNTDQKQNVFDDFIAAAEWLIANKYTSTPKLAIAGGSNGGLLVGAAMTQRPDLFGACLPAVGVMDMLRFHKFTIGWAWVPDYGSSEDPAMFRYLHAYSPLHNLKPGTAYPPTFITTGDHDDRVVPAHSFKFAATLQAAQGGTAPVLIRIETKAGHGAGKPTAKLLEEAADRWAFVFEALEVKRDRPAVHP